MSIKPFLLTHREVCARRASKLRKRGEDVYFHHSTPNGKARYRWFVAAILYKVTP